MKNMLYIMADSFRIVVGVGIGLLIAVLILLIICNVSGLLCKVDYSLHLDSIKKKNASNKKNDNKEGK